MSLRLIKGTADVDEWWRLPTAEVPAWYDGAWVDDGMRLKRSGSFVNDAVARVVPDGFGGDTIVLTYPDRTTSRWGRREVAVNGWRPVLG